MAQTLKARAGSSLKARFSYLDANGEPMETSGQTAQISIRSIKPSTRIIVHAEESEVENSTLQTVAPAQWRLYLSGAITKILPPTVVWELELVNDADPDDVTTLANGTIITSPEQVKNGD